MIIEIITGTVLGTGLFGWIAYWWTKRKKERDALEATQREEDNIDEESEALLKLEYQLKNAIFETAQNIKHCNQELKKMYVAQLELLEDVAKVNYIAVEGKPLFFKWTNRLEEKTRYFYQRDLKTHLEPAIIQKTKTVVQNYQAEIDLYLSKRALFERLLHSHHRNLNRLKGESQRDEQLEKLERFQKELDNRLDQNVKVEEQALRGEQLLESIQAKLAHQEACLVEYTKLNAAFEANQNVDAARRVKSKIDTLIRHLDA